jgi:hypothetical protein
MAAHVTIERPNDRVIVYRRRVDSWWEAKRELGFFGPGWLFRGHADSSFALSSTLQRSGAADLIAAEQITLKHFQHRAHLFIPTGREPKHDLEWLALIQHHGGPTRLVDFTRSGFVAAYFALEADANGDDCCIWAVEQWPLRQVAARVLSRASHELSYQPEHSFNDSVEECIRTQPQTRFLVPIEPYRLNARMALQQGLFLCVGDLSFSVFDNIASDPNQGDPLPLVQLVFPRFDRAKALADLREMNLSRETLFPGLDGLAQTLRHLILPRVPNKEAIILLLERPGKWPGPEDDPRNSAGT